MSNTVIIVLIIAIAVVVVIIVLRRKLREFFIRAGGNGIEAGVQTHENPSQAASSDLPGKTDKPHGIEISHVIQIGKDHEVDVNRNDVAIHKVKQIGQDHKLEVQPNTKSHKRKK